jgi:hypothetical protein
MAMSSKIPGNTRDYISGVQQANRKRTARFWLIVLVVIIVLVAILYWMFNPNRPVDYAEAEDHFKYGSIGAEEASGIPYPVFKIMPKLCSAYLPGEGLQSLGFIQEEGHEFPIGLAQRQVFVNRVALNCAGCHTGTVRDNPNSEPRIYTTMPANTLYLENYIKFLASCGADERFTPGNVMAFIKQDESVNLNFLETFLYRYFIVTRIKNELLRQRDRLSFLASRPAWGPGRVDTFSPYKTLQFNFPMENDHSIGTTDYPSIWNQRPREGMQLHWDGNTTSVRERNLSASLGAGVTPPTVDHKRLNRVLDWLLDLPAPPYPYDIDQDLARQGEVIYQEQCASCHAFDGEYVGTVVPIEEIRTDPYRLESWSYELLSNFYTLYAGFPDRFKHFRKTDGYTNQPLDGIWLRAPYLHNGSVPNLHYLLEVPENRPQKFYRGYDVYDRENVGFVSDVTEEKGLKFFEFDTSIPGNSNEGHLYGTDLSPAEKDALVEYMKTL